MIKRSNFGQTWGKFALAGSQVAVLVTSYTMLMVTINAYSPISVWLAQHGVLYFPFWLFLLIAILPVVIAYIVAWKILVPYFYHSSVEQFMNQNKELVDGLKEVSEIKRVLAEELPVIKSDLEILLKK